MNKYILFTLMLVLFSCSKVEPAQFWMQYEPNHRVHQQSDQGPWGGYRTIHWSNVQDGQFDSTKMLKFAKDNGWTLVDSSFHSSSQIINWKFDDHPIFPLTWTGFDPEINVNHHKFDDFPRWIESDLQVYHFETGWISVQPGIGDNYHTNGFVVLDKNRKKMTLYHMWGE